MFIFVSLNVHLNAGNSISNVIVDVVYSDVSCYSANDGEILVDISGGTPPYFFTWTYNSILFSADEDILLLEPGEYCLSVTDSVGLTTTICQTINEPTPLTISGQVDQISCNSAHSVL